MRPSREVVLMEMAMAAAKRSTCSRASVGVVVARDGRPLVTGYNGAPAGMAHCDHSCDCMFPGEGGLLFEGKHLSNCVSLVPCVVAVHAEANAIAYAARWGIALEGATLVTTHSSCLACAKLVINAGIRKVVSRDPALLGHGVSSVGTGFDLLKIAGVDLAFQE